MQRHLYIPQLRPARLTALPRGVDWTYVEAPGRAWIGVHSGLAHLPVSEHPYGVIGISRELTEAEAKWLDLKKVSEADRKTLIHPRIVGITDTCRGDGAGAQTRTEPMTQTQTQPTATLTAIDLVSGAEVATKRREPVRKVAGSPVAAARAAAKAAVQEMWKGYSSKSNAQKAAKKLDAAQVVERDGGWGVLSFAPVSEAEVDEVPAKQIDRSVPMVVEAPVAAPEAAVEAPVAPVAPVAAAPAPRALTAPATSTGHARHNRNLASVLTALRGTPGGVTLGELTDIAEWRMPFAVANLRILERKHAAAGEKVRDDGAVDIRARRYWLAK